MKEPLIKRAESNNSKGKTYSAQLSKYNEAMAHGFYGEAELVVYAFLEDRLRAFIYYSNLLDSFNSNDINENAEEMYGKALNIKDISCKITIIRRALKVCTAAIEDLSPFEISLRRGYTSAIDKRGLKQSLKQLEKWCKYRNEIVHGLFNKDLDTLRHGYEQHVKEGMAIARFLDQQVRKLKDS